MRGISNLELREGLQKLVKAFDVAIKNMERQRLEYERWKIGSDNRIKEAEAAEANQEEQTLIEQEERAEVEEKEGEEEENENAAATGVEDEFSKEEKAKIEGVEGSGARRIEEADVAKLEKKEEKENEEEAGAEAIEEDRLEKEVEEAAATVEGKKEAKETEETKQEEIQERQQQKPVASMVDLSRMMTLGQRVGERKVLLVVSMAVINAEEEKIEDGTVIEEEGAETKKIEEKKEDKGALKLLRRREEEGAEMTLQELDQFFDLVGQAQKKYMLKEKQMGSILPINITSAILMGQGPILEVIKSELGLHMIMVQEEQRSNNHSSDSSIIWSTCFKIWDPGGSFLTLIVLFLHLEDKVNFKGGVLMGFQ